MTKGNNNICIELTIRGILYGYKVRRDGGVHILNNRLWGECGIPGTIVFARILFGRVHDVDNIDAT